MDMPLQRPTPDPNDPLEAREQEALDALADTMDEPLAVRVVERHGLQVIYAEGEVDVYTAQILEERLLEILAAGPAGVIIDLSRTQYIDSRGLAVLLRATRALPGALAVVSTRERITRLFQQTGLSKSIAVHKSLPEAVDALRA